MLVDCFTYFNERDLLEVRLHTLAPYVDEFILCEANRTFQGSPKQYCFENPGVIPNAFGTGRRLYVVHADLSCFDGSRNPWLREGSQRKALGDRLSTLMPLDRIILSDVDEIPDMEDVSLAGRPIVTWTQDLYYYWVNMRCWKWTGSISCTWRTVGDFFRGDLQMLREYRHHVQDQIEGGWHFSFLGGPEAIKTKIESFSHTEYRHMANEANISEALGGRWKVNVDLFGRKLPGMKFEVMPDDSHLPPYLQIHKDRFSQWWYKEQPCPTNQKLSC